MIFEVLTVIKNHSKNGVNMPSVFDRWFLTKEAKNTANPRVAIDKRHLPKDACQLTLDFSFLDVGLNF